MLWLREPGGWALSAHPKWLRSGLAAMDDVGLRSMKTSRSFSDETLEAQMSWIVFVFLAKSWCFFKDLFR